jgi:hypothetical protein
MDSTKPPEELALVLVRAIRNNSHLLTSPMIHLGRQLAAAGLLRCAALLEGTCIVAQAGRADLQGLLLRALFETWLVALDLLESPEDDNESLLDLFSAAANEYNRSRARLHEE